MGLGGGELGGDGGDLVGCEAGSAGAEDSGEHGADAGFALDDGAHGVVVGDAVYVGFVGEDDHGVDWGFGGQGEVLAEASDVVAVLVEGVGEAAGECGLGGVFYGVDPFAVGVGDASAVVFAFEDEEAFGGEHYEVYFGDLAVCPAEGAVVEDFCVGDAGLDAVVDAFFESVAEDF